MAIQGTMNILPVTLRGEIRRIIFETAEGSYTVLRIYADDGHEYTVVGPIAGPTEGQNIEVTGNWEKSDYGMQLRANSYRYTLPNTKDGIMRFLASGAVPGIGKTLAKNIVEHFGERTLSVLENNIDELLVIPKIGKKKLKAIDKAWKETANKREIFIFLQSLGISPAYCIRIYKRYGEQTPDAVKSNPYRLAEDVDGIGFLKADEIAKSMGIPEDSKERIGAAAVFTVNQAITDGHTALPIPVLLDKMAALVNQPFEKLQQGLFFAVSRGILVERDNYIYTPVLAHAELEIPKHVKRLGTAISFAGQKLVQLQTPKKIHLCDEQLLAIDKVKSYPLSIITGGPGVGKTTVLSTLVQRAKKSNLRIALAAPTGRAAKRLSEATGEAAKTLHRLLQYDGNSRKFVYDETNQLPYDLIIIDEISMLDILLAWSLLKAIKTGTSLLLVGDPDQLPSVGPGTVLADFLRCKYFSCTHLTKIFRQGAGSQIIDTAHKVNHGQSLLIQSPDKKTESDFYWIPQEEPEVIYSLLQKLLLERIPRKFHFHPVDDVQILTPMNRGNCGGTALNEYLQNILNPQEQSSFRYGERLFKLHDKVMQCSNNYDKNVFNGDMGKICAINTAKKVFMILFDDGNIVEYDFDEAEQIMHAYAITVHKSQGSEFKVVIMLLTNQHFVMHQRNLLYTGMTRAKKLLILIGGEKAVNHAIHSNRQQIRYSLLYKHLAEI